MIIVWVLAAVGGLSFIILITGMGVVMLCTAHDLWKYGGFGGKSFAVLFGALGALLMAPLILSMCIIIYQCVNAII